MSAADQPLLDGRTQWHRLSAPVKQPAYRYVREASCSITAAHDHDNIGVTADGEVVVGRRRSHRADVSRPRPQCPGRPPCPWLIPPWSLVPQSGTVGRAEFGVRGRQGGYQSVLSFFLEAPVVSPTRA